MKVVSFSNREFRKIPLLPLPDDVIHEEAMVYLYDDKNKWNKQKNVIKIFCDSRIIGQNCIQLVSC